MSFGVDPTALDLRTRDPGVEARVVGNLTRTWQAPGSRFSRQISLMAGFTAPQTSENCYNCWSRVGSQFAGLTAGGAVDLFRVSRFTPYAQGGLGVYYTRLSGNPPSGSALLAGTMYSRSGFSLGGNAGLGVKARFGSHEIFVEQMLHAFNLRRFDRGVYPFNIGIKF